MTILLRHTLSLFADYHQFYLQDGGLHPSPPTVWTDDDVNNRCQVAPHLVAICPLRDMVVEVELAVHDAPPPAPSVAPDHEVTCSLDLPTGQLQIHECTGTAVLDQILAPGSYRVRVAFRNLASVSADGMDGQDSYLIELWPGEATDLVVTQRWTGPQP
ncbi:MAG: hypothetical protein R3E56_14390 [Burkholderiaceae bacterium]